MICCSVNALRSFAHNQIEKLSARLLAVEGTCKIRCYGSRVLLLDAPHLHAEVLSLNNDHHSERIERTLDTIFDFGSEPLLHLQPSGEHIHHPCNLAQTCDASIGDVRHMRLAEER